MNKKIQLLPVMLCFFAMGFVDLVGIASNYVQADTVGAGDSFTGAFVACILAGKTVDEAHQIAVDVSAYVCTQSGAMPPFPCPASHLMDR